MKAQANQIRPGWVIDHQGKQWSVLKINILQPGKGSAFIQVEMRDVNTGNKTNERWRTADTVEKLNVEEQEAQYLYEESDLFYFMNKENFEQFSIHKDSVGDSSVFLKESMDVSVNFIEGRPVAIKLPQTVILEVVETEPVIKGQTATSSYKPGKLDNGARVMIPQFVGVGEKIVVNTEDSSYVERAK
ncbi:MAG: elongation factor P [Alphaproteobacteria bacterium]